MTRTGLFFSGFVVSCAAVLAIPAVAGASEVDTPAHVQRVVHHRHVNSTGAIPGGADALSAETPALRAFDNLDGLSRESGQCNTGCIDN